MKWSPPYVIALVVIVSGITLYCLGINGEIWSLVLLASGFVFGKGIAEIRIKRIDKK